MASNENEFPIGGGTYPPFGVITDGNHGSYVIIATWILACISVLSVIVRIIVRTWRSQYFERDNGLLVVATNANWGRTFRDKILLVSTEVLDLLNIRSLNVMKGITFPLRSGTSKDTIRVTSGCGFLQENRIAVHLSIITACIPSIKPFFDSIQSSLIDSGVPRNYTSGNTFELPPWRSATKSLSSRGFQSLRGIGLSTTTQIEIEGGVVGDSASTRGLTSTTGNSLQTIRSLSLFLKSVLPDTLPEGHIQGPRTADELINDVLSGIEQAPMAVKLTPHLLSLVNWADPLHDPILRQFMPLGSWIQPDHPKLVYDSLDETGDSPVEGIIHRYPDRAVFLEKKWEVMFDYIEHTPALADILVSGGDLYTLKPEQMRMIGMRLLHIPHILRIRIASKGVAVCPSRIIDPEDEWANVLIELSQKGRKMGKSVALHTHFNHPSEISWVTKKAAQRLFEEGVTIRNQTVLLNRVNNDVETMKALIHQLSAINIQPMPPSLYEQSIIGYFVLDRNSRENLTWIIVRIEAIKI
ncbi:hypothetical protein Daesc_007882 [Daldinia eschscholtzii]|uniref:Cytochrome P450 n=1 Tax=Daldinia eschscholtzii TaxID=292717 RepID=A0AAX6MF67_9PEZI